MDPITIISLLSNAIPAVVKFVKGDDAAKKAEALITVAKEITGIAEPQAAVEAIAADPAHVVAFKQRLVEIDLETIKANLADTENARALQVAALAQDDQFSKRFIYYAATGILSFVGLFIALATFVPIPQANVRFVDTALGFLLGTAASTVIQFFFGSSQQSKQKDSTVAGLLHSLKGLVK